MALPAWSVKGIEKDVREIAKASAKQEGLNLGEWLEKIIMETGEDPAFSEPPAGLQASSAKQTQQSQSPVTQAAQPETSASNVANGNFQRSPASREEQLENIFTSPNARRENVATSYKVDDPVAAGAANQQAHDARQGLARPPAGVREMAEDVHTQQAGPPPVAATSQSLVQALGEEDPSLAGELKETMAVYKQRIADLNYFDKYETVEQSLDKTQTGVLTLLVVFAVLVTAVWGVFLVSQIYGTPISTFLGL